MTRKDYLLLAEVLNRKAISADRQVKKNILTGISQTHYELGYDDAYWHIVRVTIKTLRAANPRFDADQFMRNLDK